MTRHINQTETVGYDQLAEVITFFTEEAENDF